MISLTSLVPTPSITLLAFFCMWLVRAASVHRRAKGGRMRRASGVVTVAILISGLAAIAGIRQSHSMSAQQGTVRTARADWPQWRGPNRDAAVPSFAPPARWPEQLTQRWKVEVGLGYATPLLVGDRVYMFSRQGDDEVMAAHDAASGRVLWRHAYPAPFTMNSGASRHNPGPKSTPVFANGRLYAIGMTGVVTAIDAASGKRLWQIPGGDVVPLYTTHAFSPLVDRGLVIFHVGGHNKGALTAFDANSGSVKWRWDGDGPGYGSPIAADFDGTRQIVTLTQQKVVGVEAATGALLWERPYETRSTTNSLTPLLYEGKVILGDAGHPLEALTVSKRESRWITEQVWANEEVPMRLSNAVLSDRTIFGLSTRNAGQYFAVDAATGKTLWTSEPRQAAQAAIIGAGPVLLSLENDGELVVFRNSRTAFEVLRRYKVSDTETWAPPVLSGARLFIKDDTTLSLWTID
jgi:outer membrane protein assembly factor BamB